MPGCSREDAEQETVQIRYNIGAGADGSRAIVALREIDTEGDQIENQPQVFTADTYTDIY